MDNNKHDSNEQLSLPEGLIIRTIMNNSEDTIYFKNLDSKFLLNSKAHANQFKEDDVRNLIGKDDFDYFPNEFSKAALHDEQQIIHTGKPIIGRIEKWEKPNGEVVWFSASKYPLYDEHHRIIGTWGTSRDITSLKRAEEQLIVLNQQLHEANQRLIILATRDSLSGLYNNRHFFDSLNTINAQVFRQKDAGKEVVYSIIILDVDYFKNINDSYGHLIGDTVIKTMSEVLMKSTRRADVCFRIGGDEFAVLLANTPMDKAKIVAEKLRRNVEKTPVKLEKRTIHMTVSVGVACSTEREGVTDLVALCDSRMYISKQNGRNQVN